jgi:hypothetical protein
MKRWLGTLDKQVEYDPETGTVDPRTSVTARFAFGKVTPCGCTGFRLSVSAVDCSDANRVTSDDERAVAPGHVGPPVDTSPWQFDAAIRVRTSAFWKVACWPP